METTIKGSSSFGYLDVTLAPGETIISEAGAMSSMSAKIDMKAKFNGGFFKAILRKIFGGESLFVSQFTNHTNTPQQLTLVQSTPGEMREIKLNNSTFCLQPGAYVCSTEGVKLGLRWAGFKSFIAREGLFKLTVSGTGSLWYGAYGAMIEKNIQGDYLVDSGHLVGYDPTLKLKLQLSGGLVSSFLSGEGFVTRLEGTGKVILQTRSISGLAGWINTKLY